MTDEDTEDTGEKKYTKEEKELLKHMDTLTELINESSMTDEQKYILRGYIKTIYRSSTLDYRVRQTIELIDKILNVNTENRYAVIIRGFLKLITFYARLRDVGVECAFVICGNIEDLEDIRQYIIERFVRHFHVKLVKMLYAKEDLILANNSNIGRYFHFYDGKKEKHPTESDIVYFAFLLYGEEKFIKKIEEHINHDNSVDLCECVYSRERMNIIRKSLWDDYKKAEEEEKREWEEFKKKYKAFLTVKDDETDVEEGKHEE